MLAYTHSHRHAFHKDKPALVAQLDGGGNILFWRFIMKYFFTVILLSLLLIQEGQLSVSGKNVYYILVNHLED